MRTRSDSPDTASAGRTSSITVIAGYGLAIAQALESRGVDSRRVFAAAGIDASLDNDPLKRLPLAAVTRLYAACVAATGDPYFGLTVAKFMQPATLHALGYGLLASSTLWDFCVRVQRYFRLLSQTAHVHVVPQADGVHLRFVPLVGVSPQSQDAWLGTMHRTIRLLYRDDFRPVAVQLLHAMPPGGDGPYIEFFGGAVGFGADAATLVLPHATMDVRLHGSSPELAQLSDSLAADYIAKLDRSDVVANVRACIVELLPSGECSQQKVAAKLAMSRTTLQQRLLERGTSFHELRSEVRSELASGYLQRSDISVTEICYLLGFSDVSNFTRAFKRWTGVPPTRFRRPG